MRNPAWIRDELILALDLYMTNPASAPGKSSPEVIQLSAMLNQLSSALGRGGDESFRNPNGVYLKMMNLRALDPAFTAQGKVGMQSGGALEKEIWAEFVGHGEELKAEANRIRSALALSGNASLPAESEYEGEEGGVVVRLHRRYERDRKLVDKKKKQAKELGSLSCEVCGFDFQSKYGALGTDFIEVHHTKPVHQMKTGEKTKLADLALLCSNCHRMAHRKREPLGMEALRSAYCPGPAWPHT